MQILSQGKYQNAEISNLIDQIKKYLKINYISLIYLYSKNNQTDKVLETARKWKHNTSEWAQVSLFKVIWRIMREKAINAMNMALASTKIDTKIKHRILNEF
jgi:hypothetical protein